VVRLIGESATARSPSMTAVADRHLLFGLLALQTGLIQESELVAAFHAWTAEKAAPLADHLVAQAIQRRPGQSRRVALGAARSR
jgi:hypothetical protein